MIEAGRAVTTASRGDCAGDYLIAIGIGIRCYRSCRDCSHGTERETLIGAGRDSSKLECVTLRKFVKSLERSRRRRSQSHRLIRRSEQW